MDLLRRSITSVAWNTLANVISIAILFVRSVVLARLLPVEVFGIYAGATAVILLTSVFAGFGLGAAFLNRAEETEDEDRAAALYLTLNLITASIWAVLMATGALLLTEGPTLTALLVLTGTTFLLNLAAVPQTILTRRVVHRRLALLQLTLALVTTAAAVPLAARGAGLWALLATDLVAALTTFLLLYAWRPVWRPHLAWSAEGMRYFLRLGRGNVVAAELARLLDHLDSLWTRLFLGAEQLGFYSRAYTFATYPRTIIATPVNRVMLGTYAELKQERLHLSQAFFRSNAFLTRLGFPTAGLLLLLAPELIVFLLGSKWLPMLPAFRLMLVFTLLDPLRDTTAGLFTATGLPQTVIRARVVQLLVLAVGLFTLGPRFGIIGVAVAVDLMLVVGVSMLLWSSLSLVDFSLWHVFGPPTVALAAGLGVGIMSLGFVGVDAADPLWLSAVVKAVSFSLLYVAVWLLLERRVVLQYGGKFIGYWCRGR